MKNCYSILFMLLLSGCTTNGFIFRAPGGYDSTNEAQPVYKIGEPYQVGGVSYTPKENYQYNETGIAGWYTYPDNHITSNGEKYSADIASAAHKTLPLPSIVKITNLENNKSTVVRVNERGPLVNNRLIDVSQKAAEELGFRFNETTLVRVEILSAESQALKAELPPAEKDNTPPLNAQPIQMNELTPLYEPDEDVVKPIYSPEPEGANKTPTTDDKTSVIPIQKGHYIQYGAFKNNENALNLKEKIDLIHPSFVMEKQSESGVLYRLRSGPFENREKALSILDKITQEGYGNSQIIYEQ